MDPGNLGDGKITGDPEARNRFWKTKVAAWVHDPAEKAFVLLEDRAGHEGGSVRHLKRELFGEGGPGKAIGNFIEAADHRASAADRPTFPRREGDSPYAAWTQVKFLREPELIHPLTGETYFKGENLTELQPHLLKALSFEHASGLILREVSGSAGGEESTDPGPVDWRRTYLSFWRNQPVPPHRELGVLWGLMPADTRVPHHSIWQHLRLTSALAGILSTGSPAHLLSLSFGPVQGFIAQARSTSDLWAGSHLLSRIAWEGMRVICEELGPDHLIFPDLFEVPQVDAWLEHEMKVPVVPERDESSGTDHDPVFAAALPNRFMALVPGKDLEGLVERITTRTRSFGLDRAREACRKLWEGAGRGDDPITGHAGRQIERQLAGFPEISWASVLWDLKADTKSAAKDLEDGLDAFGCSGKDKGLKGRPAAAPSRLDAFGCSGKDKGPDDKLTFLGSDTWKVLNQEVKIEGTFFYSPNPGVLYPAAYDLVERAAAAGKAARPFDGGTQHGYRCTLCGENEWLAGSASELEIPKGSRGPEVGWVTLARSQPSWVRDGEFLCARCALKRLWPTLFVDEVQALRKESGGGSELRRYVVSTHTMALCPVLDSLIPADETDAEDPARFEKLAQRVENLSGWVADVHRATGGASQGKPDRAALPHSLARRAWRARKRVEGLDDLVRELPAAIDRLRDRIRSESSPLPGTEPSTSKQNLEELDRKLGKLLGEQKLETYYALVLLDGDRMGAWLSGGGEGSSGPGSSHGPTCPPLGSFWHSKVRKGVEDAFQDPAHPIHTFGKAASFPFPARHGSISSALNGFSVHLARLAVEDLFKGKLIYAGGDDLLAMVSVDDLPGLMLLLRVLYSGSWGAPPTSASTSEGETRSGVLAPDDPLRFLGADPVRSREIELRLARGFVKYRIRGHNRLLRVMGSGATASVGAVVAHHMAPLGRVLGELRAAESRAKQDLAQGGGGRNAFSIRVLKRSGGAEHLTLGWRFDPGGDARKTSIGILIRLRNWFGRCASRRAAYHIQEWARHLPVPESASERDKRGTLPEDELKDLMSRSLIQQLKRQEIRETGRDVDPAGDENSNETPSRDEERQRLVEDLVALCFAEDPRDPGRVLRQMIPVSEFFAREGRGATDHLTRADEGRS